MCISAEDARAAPLLESGSERAALALWQDRRDPAAAETLIRSHARLVHAIVRRWRRAGEERDDLVSAGMFGLLTAAERFDLRRPVRFATYARWWIMTTVGAEVAAQRSILSVPARMYHDMIGGRLTEPDFELLQSCTAACLSLDDTGRDGATRLFETLPSEAPTAEETLIETAVQRDLRALLDAAIADLPDPLRQIMELRARPEPEAHGAIASALGLDPARVRVLEDTAHLRLRRTLLGRGFSPESLR